LKIDSNLNFTNMKKMLQKLVLGLFLTLCISKWSSAQIISYPTPAQNISRSLDSTLLTVRLDFPACTGLLVTVNLGVSNNPGNVEYVPGSITKIGGTASLAINENNITNKRNPVFSVSNTAAGDFIIFTLKRKVNCGIGASSKDNIRVTGSAGCSFIETDNSVNTYNILAPALALGAVADITNATIGSTYTRTITLIKVSNW
jgi:hypothetical protein